MFQSGFHPNLQHAAPLCLGFRCRLSSLQTSDPWPCHSLRFFNTPSRSVLRASFFSFLTLTTTTSADFSRRPIVCRYPFRIKARSPQVRTHSFIAQPPDLHRLALVMRVSRFVARSPCAAVPHIWFLSIGSQFMLHASSPHSVILVQLRFTSFVMTNLRWDSHPQECAHAGRTAKSPLPV